VSEHDEAVTPASHHPAIAGREQSMSDLADTVRHLIGLVVTNTAPAPVLVDVVSQLRASAEVLEQHVPDHPVPRFVEPPEAGPARVSMSTMNSSMPYDPVVGRFNPIALPVTITFEPPLAVGHAHFTTPYEGGPGWVHGAAIAAAFDIVLTAANHIAGAAGPTVWLTIRFRRPTLVHEDARFEAEVVSNDGRRVTSKGRLIQDGMVCVEAEGEFAVIDARRLRTRRPRDNRRGGGDTAAD
jgi:acyl-coenzyme A thioesterase PaaI-like protein